MSANYGTRADVRRSIAPDGLGFCARAVGSAGTIPEILLESRSQRLPEPPLEENRHADSTESHYPERLPKRGANPQSTNRIKPDRPKKAFGDSLPRQSQQNRTTVPKIAT